MWLTKVVFFQVFFKCTPDGVKKNLQTKLEAISEYFSSFFFKTKMKYKVLINSNRASGTHVQLLYYSLLLRLTLKHGEA